MKVLPLAFPLHRSTLCQIAAWQPSNCALKVKSLSQFFSLFQRKSDTWADLRGVSVEICAVKTASPAVLKWVKMLAWQIGSGVNKSTHGRALLLPRSFTLRWIFKHPYIMLGICSLSWRTKFFTAVFPALSLLSFDHTSEERTRESISLACVWLPELRLEPRVRCLG